MNALTRREFSALAGAAFQRGPAGRPPNIVLLLLDDLGYGDLGCYGQTLIRTPNIDRIAREGTRFTDCYAGGVVCAPSRSVLMTGLHAGHAPVRANAGTYPLAADDRTVARVLHDAGYATGGFGKWGLGDAGSTGVPTRHGFDEFFGYLHQVHAHSYYPEFLWENEKKIPLAGNADGRHATYSADLIAARSLEFVREHRSEPFFLYACTTLPHAKFEPPDLAPYQEMPWSAGQKAYAAMVTRADAYAGRIVALLKELGLDRNTAVFVASDNGAHSGGDKGFELFRSNGPLRGEKGQLYEGGIRVPMIVRWPGKVRAGRVDPTPWAFCDIMPTFAELAGAKAPARIDGISMLSRIRGDSPPAREYLYWESNAWNGKAQSLVPGRLQQAVRMGTFKAIRSAPAAAIELYDLDRDPGETADVAAQNPVLVKRAAEIFVSAHSQPRPHDTGRMEFVQ